MKKIVCVLSVLALAACAGNDGYKVQDVWTEDGEIHARADATEKSKELCYNKARLNARDKVSNYVVTTYMGTDNLTINNAEENYSSNRSSETKSMFTGATYLLKEWDKETKTCGVELVISIDDAQALLSENN